MNADFKEAMSNRTDEDLIKIVTVEREDYQPLAVEAAEREIENRGLDTTSIEQVIPLEKQYVTLQERIGRIAFNFSALELVLCCFVTRLISEDSKIGAIITSEMSFQNLLKIFDSLAQYKIPETNGLNAIRAIIKRLNIAEQERNSVIHSAYGSKDKENENDSIRLKITAKQGKGLKVTAEVVDIEKFKRVSNDCVLLIHELEDIYRAMYNDEVLKFA